MQTFVIVIHLMIVLAMVGLVLLQKSEGGGLGIGSSGGFMSSRGTTNVLTRSTAILAACFFATSLCCRSWPAGAAIPARSCDHHAWLSASEHTWCAARCPGTGGGVLEQLQKQEQAPRPQRRNRNRKDLARAG